MNTINNLLSESNELAKDLWEIKFDKYQFKFTNSNSRLENFSHMGLFSDIPYKSVDTNSVNLLIEKITNNAFIDCLKIFININKIYEYNSYTKCHYEMIIDEYNDFECTITKYEIERNMYYNKSTDKLRHKKYDIIKQGKKTSHIITKKNLLKILQNLIENEYFNEYLRNKINNKKYPDSHAYINKCDKWKKEFGEFVEEDYMEYEDIGYYD